MTKVGHSSTTNSLTMIETKKHNKFQRLIILIGAITDSMKSDPVINLHFLIAMLI